MKKILVVIILFFSILSNMDALELNSKNAVLYNLDTDLVLYAQNEDEITSIASLTKIMTAIVAIENIEDLNSVVEIKEDVFLGLLEQGAYQAGLKLNDKVSYYDLLYALLLPSGADAAQALAINVAGSINNFVDLMNQKKDELNLLNTHFENPIGLDSSDNYSTVKDVLKLLKYALKNETFYKIFTTDSYTLQNGLSVKNSIYSYTDKYKIDASLIYGSKTGYTHDAGLCLASIYKKDNTNLLLITLGAYSSVKYPYHILDAVNTYKYYEENYGYKSILNKDDLITTLKLKGITFKDKIEVRSDEEVLQYLKNDSKITYEYTGKTKVSSADYKTKIGQYKIYGDSKLIYTYDVILNEEIKDYKLHVITVISLVIFIIIMIIYKKNK